MPSGDEQSNKGAVADSTENNINGAQELIHSGVKHHRGVVSTQTPWLCFSWRRGGCWMLDAGCCSLSWWELIRADGAGLLLSRPPALPEVFSGSSLGGRDIDSPQEAPLYRDIKLALRSAVQLYFPVLALHMNEQSGGELTVFNSWC